MNSNPAAILVKVDIRENIAVAQLRYPYPNSPSADTTLYGGRVLVSDYSQINAEGEREEYIPVAQIMGVQFKNCGQRGYRDYWDPRYALALQNTKPGEDSYVKSCAVDVSHNHAIGIIGSHNVEVSGNVVYHSRGSGILSNSENVSMGGSVLF